LRAPQRSDRAVDGDARGDKRVQERVRVAWAGAVALLDPAAKLKPQHRRSPRLVKRSHHPGGVVREQHVPARAWEQREVDVRDRRIARTVIGGLAAVEESLRVLGHDRRLRDEIGERQLAHTAAERGYVTVADGLLGDRRQPRTSLPLPASRARQRSAAALSRQAQQGRARSPRSGCLDSRAKRSYPYPTTTTDRHAQCGLIQPAICGVKSDTGHVMGTAEITDV
jgi:hypothetical protein